MHYKNLQVMLKSEIFCNFKYAHHPPPPKLFLRGEGPPSYHDPAPAGAGLPLLVATLTSGAVVWPLYQLLVQYSNQSYWGGQSQQNGPEIIASL